MAERNENGRAGWPRSLIELADAIGDELALEVQAAYGGRRLYVPQKRIESSGLAGLIGPAAVRRLVRAGYGGQYLEVATHHSMAAARRRAAIEASNGSATELARRFRCSERRIRQIRKAQRELGA